MTGPWSAFDGMPAGVCVSGTDDTPATLDACLLLNLVQWYGKPRLYRAPWRDRPWLCQLSMTVGTGATPESAWSDFCDLTGWPRRGVSSAVPPPVSRP